MNNSDMLKAYELLERIAVDQIILKEKLDSGVRDAAKSMKKLESLETQILNMIGNMNNKD